MGEGVSPADVIRVFKAHRVSTYLVDEKTHKYTLERDDFMETVILTDEVVSRYLQYFKRKLKIPIHHFWHPEQAEKDCECETDE